LVRFQRVHEFGQCRPRGRSILTCDSRHRDAYTTTTGVPARNWRDDTASHARRGSVVNGGTHADTNAASNVDSEVEAEVEREGEGEPDSESKFEGEGESQSQDQPKTKACHSSDAVAETGADASSATAGRSRCAAEGHADTNSADSRYRSREPQPLAVR
jgi:hypothetical protein